MKYKYLLKGIIKSIPGVEYIYDFHKRSRTGGDTENARYCYSIWLRHIVLAYKNGGGKIPETLVELGPGTSLGVGIAALLSGSKKYYGLDIVRYSTSEININVLEILVELFVNKTPIPDNTEFPLIHPQLDNYSFPEHIITESIIADIKQGDIVLKIRDAIADIDKNKLNSIIEYTAPWDDVVIEKGTVDMVLSHGTLQNVDDVEESYRKMNLWLKENGVISSTIDFKSLMSSDEWFGHWTYSDLEWKIIRGRKSFYTNRLPLSAHVLLLKKYSFKLTYITKKTESNIVRRDKLAARFKELTDEDIHTSVCFFVAVKMAK